MPIGWLKKSILRYKLKYFGHLKRNDSLGKIITEEKMKGKKAAEKAVSKGNPTYPQHENKRGRKIGNG